MVAAFSDVSQNLKAPVLGDVARHFQLLSEMSVNDLATIGHSFGFSPTLDNTKSMKYNGTYPAVGGTGLYINKPPSTSYAGINLSNSGAAHPLSNCRLYYSQIMLDPQKSITYTNMNLNKKVVYRTFVSNQYNNIGKGSSFNQLINSGIVHPTGVLIVPFIGAQSSVGFGDYQWKSPFDTCPATTPDCSITNLQVAIGGSNVLQSTLYSTYKNFIEQVNLAEQLTSSDFGVSTGLINQGYWEWSRWYYVNVERSQAADKLQPR